MILQDTSFSLQFQDLIDRINQLGSESQPRDLKVRQPTSSLTLKTVSLTSSISPVKLHGT